MFKLVKILNSKTNVPELHVNIPCGVSNKTIWEEGTICFVNNGVLTITDTQDESVFVVCKTVITNGENDLVECYKITPNMIFESDRVIMNQTVMAGLRGNVYKGTRYMSISNAANKRGPVIVDMLGNENAKPGTFVNVLVAFDTTN